MGGTDSAQQVRLGLQAGLHEGSTPVPPVAAQRPACTVLQCAGLHAHRRVTASAPCITASPAPDPDPQHAMRVPACTRLPLPGLHVLPGLEAAAQVLRGSAARPKHVHAGTALT